MKRKPENVLEIFQLLEKSNCKECGEKTCLAFAGAVFTGQRKFSECPRLSRVVIERYSVETDDRNTKDPDREKYLKSLQSEIVQLDFAQAAERTGAQFSGDKLTLKILGKDFSVNAQGDLFADIHINPWVAIPFLSYILHGQGLPVSGRWVSFRELKKGREWYPLFQKRCEEPVKRLADIHTDLFDNMVHLFSGKQVEQQFQSDISVVLHPLPKVPIMICYWSPEEGLDSSLNIFFDETADRNLEIGSVFTLGTGLAQMFTNIVLRHGFTEMISDR